MSPQQFNRLDGLGLNEQLTQRNTLALSRVTHSGGPGDAARRAMPLETNPAARPLRVLLADDDDDSRALMVASLTAEGFEVVEARDGGELLDRLSEAMAEPSARPDAVVTDVLMPRLSGLGVLDALHRARLQFPVVLVTVLNDDSIHVVARRLGAVRVLRKPLDLADLCPAVREACAWHTRAAELRGVGAPRG